MVHLEFWEDPAALLDRAGEYLARDGLLNTVVNSVTNRAVVEDRAGVVPAPDAPRWWMTAIDDSAEVVGVAMRTATGAPYPVYVLSMPHRAAVAFARALHERGEGVTALNGALPSTRVCAEALARIEGGEVVESQRTRLFELGELVPPSRRPTGSLRPAAPEDADVCLEWILAFLADADEQAGRPVGSSPEISTFSRADMLRRIADHVIWLWVEEDDTPVHLTGANPPSFGVTRIGPVYTPPECRGRGYASAAVAEVSRLVREGGSRVCLFTDQANPTSNHIYQALGYEPVADMVNLTIRR